MSQTGRWRSRIATAGVLLIVALPIVVAVVSARQHANRQASRQKLKQIGIALHAYHDQYECFPPAYVRGPDGKPWHSWRVLILPYLGEQPLYERYRFDEPWDGPHNKQLQVLRPDAYASKLQESNLKTVTTYLGVISRRTMWPAHYCVSLNDVTDGPSNTIMLLENRSSDVIWSEPREMREANAIALLRPAPVPPTKPTSEAIPTLFADGSVRMISRELNRDLFVSLLTPKYGTQMVGGEWPDDETSPSRIPDVRDISHYPGTVVLTTADASFDPQRSSIYCATTQLAWDHLRPADGQSVQADAASPVAASLNAHPFPKDGLDEKAYFVSSARLDDASSGAMFDAFRRRFPNAPVEALGNKSGRTDGMRILAYLEKSMPFPEVMERIEKPLSFGEAKVQSFGATAKKGGTEVQVLPNTVEVRDFMSEEDFIVLLNTNSHKADEIILARVESASSLVATWVTVVDRLEKPKDVKVVRELREIDELQIPILSFGVTAQLHELIGLQIPTADNSGRCIGDARQTIRFRLDEYGAELIADTQMLAFDFDGPAQRDPRAPRRLIFDRPFLVAIREKGATVPYFLGWIGNAHLMELAKKSDSR